MAHRRHTAHCRKSNRRGARCGSCGSLSGVIQRQLSLRSSFLARCTVPKGVETEPLLGALRQKVAGEKLRIDTTIRPDVLNPLKNSDRRCVSNAGVAFDLQSFDDARDDSKFIGLSSLLEDEQVARKASQNHVRNCSVAGVIPQFP